GKLLNSTQVSPTLECCYSFKAFSISFAIFFWFRLWSITSDHLSLFVYKKLSEIPFDWLRYYSICRYLYVRKQRVDAVSFHIHFTKHRKRDFVFLFTEVSSFFICTQVLIAKLILCNSQYF